MIEKAALISLHLLLPPPPPMLGQLLSLRGSATLPMASAGSELRQPQRLPPPPPPPNRNCNFNSTQWRSFR